MLYISNAFSINMLHVGGNLSVEFVSRDVIVSRYRFSHMESAVGHVSTAALFSRELGREIPANRTTLRLAEGDILVVGQYRGPRLEEGTTSLPGEEVDWSIQWAVVTFQGERPQGW